MDNLLRFNNKQKYIIIDWESNGLNLIYSKPWQLSWIVCDSKEVLSEHDYFIKWDNFTISDEVAKINHFNWITYKQRAQNLKLVYDKFMEFVNNPEYIVICHNLLNFDIFMLVVMQKALNLPVDYNYLYRSIDTKAIYAGSCKNIEFQNCKTKNDFLALQFSATSLVEKGLKSSQLHLLKTYEIEHDETRLHESLYDVTMLFEIFKKMLWKIEIPDINLLPEK